MNQFVNQLLMRFSFFILTILFVGLFQRSNAQTNTASFVPYQSDYYHLVRRYEIRKGKFHENLHSSILPLSRYRIAVFADSLWQDSASFSLSDRFNTQYLLNDNWEFAKYDRAKQKAFLRYFYKQKPDFLSYTNEHYEQKLNKGSYDFDIHVNPILHLSIGKDNQREQMLMLNTRGAVVYGSVARRVGFYTSVLETQAIFPKYVQNVIDSLSLNRALENFVVPNEAFAKPFGENGVDFLRAEGYITFKAAKVIDVTFGQGKHFIGNGYRSLVLSDFSAPYLFLKLQTRFWKINYTNLYTQMVADVQRANTLYPKKYVVYHHLSLDVSEQFNIGVFEGIAYGREDQKRNDTFELAYLNPFIFYRAVEQGLGSVDNALLGADFKWIALPKLQFYGQIVLDEFKIAELMANNGWWGNKYGIQLGVHAVDILPNLDLQLEGNIVRPYTYTHSSDNQSSNFTNYRQALAHPLGANFRELVSIVRYQPLQRLNLTAKLIYARTGEDRNGSNVGVNLLISNANVANTNEYGNYIGQGVDTKIMFGRLTASYQIYHNLFIDADVIQRSKVSALADRGFNSTIFSAGLRMNIGQRLYEF